MILEKVIVQGVLMPKFLRNGKGL